MLERLKKYFYTWWQKPIRRQDSGNFLNLWQTMTFKKNTVIKIEKLFHSKQPSYIQNMQKYSFYRMHIFTYFPLYNKPILLDLLRLRVNVVSVQSRGSWIWLRCSVEPVFCQCSVPENWHAQHRPSIELCFHCRTCRQNDLVCS